MLTRVPPAAKQRGKFLLFFFFPAFTSDKCSISTYPLCYLTTVIAMETAIMHSSMGGFEKDMAECADTCKARQ